MNVTAAYHLIRGVDGPRPLGYPAPTVTDEAPSRPFIRVRGRSFMALVVAPELPVAGWLAALDEQMRRSPSFFEARPVMVDLSAVADQEDAIASLIDALLARDIRIIGVEGVDSAWAGTETWGRPPLMRSAGRADRFIEVANDEAEQAEQEPPPREGRSLVVTEPVRSGQAVVFEDGDVTVVGSVASGAEVIAGGSVHVYGTLRGRAIAGLSDSGARIFCRRLQAELLAINGVYKTADDMEPGLRGRAVQAWLDDDVIRMAPLDGSG